MSRSAPSRHGCSSLRDRNLLSRSWDWATWPGAKSKTGVSGLAWPKNGRPVNVEDHATSISLLVVLGVREDGQKVLLAIKSMGGESAEAWRTVLDDLITRGLKRPEFLIVDGAPGLDKAIASVWDGVPVQRCTVHKHRNLFAHAT